ncbi:hypothetical protein T02_2929 [Trichinella nativa]|uniref:Uncharacterized protein n=2 Tax=Trichinella TaxID=6333 RepID=A0A0V1L694_9BILA|nr:hypothetical protein T05_13153 [Trichinella murrelli]KRX75668.1 hypothetical protein T06_3370 [Trichinella sp. T6]KRZ55065.1 hypothetical protein T02_2929 [Trichinella nativa]KRZ86953.1 hypothetical protein T08_1684 [Trichinella sp. T8]
MKRTKEFVGIVNCKMELKFVTLSVTQMNSKFALPLFFRQLVDLTADDHPTTSKQVEREENVSCKSWSVLFCLQPLSSREFG